MSKLVGKIAIIGKPNVGKSSLINKIFDEKISIINSKPQTTRNKITSIFNSDKYNIFFIDTPGFHNEKNKLDKFLNQEVISSIKDADLIYFLTDPTRNIDNEDIELLNLIKKISISKILVITKNDIANKEQIETNLEQINEYVQFDKEVYVNNNSFENIKALLSESEEYLQSYQFNFYNDNDTIQKDLFLVREIIREQCLISLQKEVPYGVAVLIDDFKYDKDKNEFIINASLTVEKESQKKILIGVNGSMIKQISMNSRHELLKIYNSKIFLKLFVKVSKNWRNDDVKLKEFGYSI